MQRLYKIQLKEKPENNESGTRGGEMQGQEVIAKHFYSIENT